MIERQKPVSAILEDLVAIFAGRIVTLGELLERLGHQATAVILVIFSIPAIIPTPGIPAGMIFGSALALLSLQLLAGGERFILPKRLARVKLPQGLLQRMLAWLSPKLAWLESWMRPRMPVLSHHGFLKLHGLFVFLMAVLIALPIPFGNVLPGLAIFLVGLGLAQRDGATILVGWAFGFAAIAFTAFLFLGGWWLLSEWLGWSVPTQPAS